VTQTNPGAERDGSLYEQHRSVIDQVVSATARLQRLAPDVADDFRSFVWERLLESDILARFEQRCSIRTFLTVVVKNLFRDFRNHRWGKWRHSAAARRLGPLARRVELLVSRDGHSVDEVMEMLTTDGSEAIDRRTLDGIVARLPVRVRPRQVGEEILDTVAATSGDADTTVDGEWLERRGREVKVALAGAIDALAADDALLLRLLFEDGFTVAQAAEAMHVPQKPLYRRRDQVLRVLRRQLEAAGVSADEIGELVGRVDDTPEAAPGTPRPIAITGARA
jgi:RNA polymerase sigma factor (sigma-70 family)